MDGSPQQSGPEKKTKVDCPCGEHIVGSDEGDLIAKVRAHLQEQHPTHEYSDEQILSIAY
jgi:hypothetical protein